MWGGDNVTTLPLPRLSIMRTTAGFLLHIFKERSVYLKQYKFNNLKNIHVIEIKKSEIESLDFVKGKEPRETLKSFYDRQTLKPDIITNAGYFNMKTGESVFNFVDNGKVESTAASYKWGMGITAGGELKYGCVDSGEFKDFVSGFPVFLDGGVKVDMSYAKEVDYRARRTMLGYNDTTVFIVLIENPGAKLDLCQQIMFELGCKYAINLDGGGSTKALDKQGKSITADATNRPVDNFFCVYLKTEKKRIYRVQVGAFGVEANATRLAEELKSKGYPAFVLRGE